MPDRFSDRELSRLGDDHMGCAWREILAQASVLLIVLLLFADLFPVCFVVVVGLASIFHGELSFRPYVLLSELAQFLVHTVQQLKHAEHTTDSETKTND